MATVIGVMGESGSGKTTSVMPCDPKKTYIIDCDKKGLSWKGWKKQYSTANKNFYQGSDPEQIAKLIKGISDTRKDINAIIVDTVNGIMVDDEMNRMKEKGYDKWQDLALSVYSLISNAHYMRDDLCIVFMFHVQDDRDENGNHHYHILTSGRKLEKIKIESKLTTVLFAKGNQGKHVFETQANNSTAKSPLGLFYQTEIQNDLNAVINAITKYEKGE
jgi:hypothetical protein